MRVPRKVKKWHRRRGWELHFGADGVAYWTRDIVRIDLSSGRFMIAL